MAYRKPDPALPKIGARLAGATSPNFQMATLVGTETSTWGTYEAGLARIPPDQALKLSPYGIPLDWIYDGKMAKLLPHIRTKIRQLDEPQNLSSRVDHSPCLRALQRSAKA